MPFDFSKPMFFGPTDMPGKGKKSGAFNSGLGNLSLAVDPALKFKNIPFDCGQFPGNGVCCFNSIIGYPQKNGQSLPIFDYEKDIVNDLDSGVKYLAIKKARGIGITELFLRYMAWLALSKNDLYKHTKFFIVCGPGESTAVDLIKRIKLILSPLGVIEDTEQTVARFVNVEVVAKPGSHVATLRGYTNIKFILIDEASFWTGEGQSNEIRPVVEGYIAKTHPIIAMVSTPHVPSTMFEKVMEEKDSLYKRYFLPYTIALNKIYSEREIELARLSPHFEREMNLKYGIGVGNIFQDRDVDAIVLSEEEEREYTPDKLLEVSIGCDPGFGSSNSSYCVVAKVSNTNKLIVLEAEQFKHASFRQFSNLIFDKFHEVRAQKIFIDASARDVVDDLKLGFREDTNYMYVKKLANHDYPFNREAWMQRMTVVPISFSEYNDKMLHELMGLVSRRDIRIPKRLDQLILDFRMAREKAGKLDKTGVNTFDLLDACRLACLMWQWQ